MSQSARPSPLDGDTVDDFVLCDSGVLSRSFSNKPLFLAAYQRVQEAGSVVISPTIYIELLHWLIGERGRIGSAMTRSEFDRNRNRLNKFPVLNHEAVATTAVAVANQFPDTGLGDCFTIGVGLVFDVPIFTLNPKHFARISGVRLYEPTNYRELLRNT